MSPNDSSQTPQELHAENPLTNATVWKNDMRNPSAKNIIQLPTICSSNPPEVSPKGQEIQDEEVPSASNWKRYIGHILALLSSLMFSINSLILKKLNYKPTIVPGMFMFYGTALLTAPFYLYHRKFNSKIDKDKDHWEKLPWKTQLLLMMRAFTGCSGMIFFFYSLNYLAVGDALVIACSFPVFVFLFAFLFLREKCGIVPIFTVFLTLCGVIIITRPPVITGEEAFQQGDLMGAGLALCSMPCIASTIVLMRYLQQIHHSLINLTFGVWGSVQTTFLAVIFGELEFPSEWTQTLLMCLTGLAFFMGQSFLALALQLEEAGPVSLIRTSEVLFAFLWQFIFLNVKPDLFSILGALIIMVGILTTILRKWIGALPEAHWGRKKFGFLLL